MSIVATRNREVSAVLLECFSCRTSVLILGRIEDEVGPAESPVLTRAFVPDRNVRRDFFLRQPAEKLRSVSRVGSETLRLYPEPLLCAPDHDAGRSHLVESSGRRRFDIDDNGGLVVNQIIQPIAELDPVVSLGG